MTARNVTFDWHMFLHMIGLLEVDVLCTKFAMPILDMLKKTQIQIRLPVQRWEGKGIFMDPTTSRLRFSLREIEKNIIFLFFFISRLIEVFIIGVWANQLHTSIKCPIPMHIHWALMLFKTRSRQLISFRLPLCSILMPTFGLMSGFYGREHLQRQVLCGSRRLHRQGWKTRKR